MVSINIGAGQGVTQAIASKLGLSKDDLKKINLSTWQNVMTEVSNAQSQIDKHNASNTGDKQKSIFTGGRDVKTINQQSNWKSNFVVQQGTVEINDSSWNKIVQMLTGKSAEPKPNEGPSPSPLDAKPQPLGGGADIPDTIELPDAAKRAATESMVDNLGGKIIERSVNGEKQDIAVVEINGQKVRREINEDGTLGDTLAATKTFGKNKYISGDFPPETKVLEREVNGKKSQIGIYEDENGNKVRKLVVTDEQTGKTTLGENLVTVSTMGKNKYVTESKFNADVKTMLGLGENDEIPADLKAEYVTIGGESSIVIKKDGKVMDSSQLRAYMAEYKANDTKLAEAFDNSFNTTGQAEIGDAAKLAKSQMNLINNKYGDKQGNISTDDMFNYELASAEKQLGRKLTDDEMANLRAMSDLSFTVFDTDESGDITEAELKAFITNANEDGNSVLTDEERTKYAEKVFGERANDNITSAENNGYTLNNIMYNGEQIPVYQKDGKTYFADLATFKIGEEFIPDDASGGGH